MRSRELSFDEYEPLDDEPSRFASIRRGLSTAVGALVALSLLMALGVWFYRLGVRDAENVPIIRASAEPAKVRPDDPGGAVAPHQEITSYRVAESEPAQATAAVIAPPPPEPKREDVAMGTLPPEPADRPDPVMPAIPPSSPGSRVAAAPAAAPAPEPAPPAAAASSQSPASGSVQPALAAGAGPSAPVLPTSVPAGATAEQASLAAPGPIPGATEYAPPLSPVAPRRPADLRERMAAAVVAAEQNAGDLARRAAESQVQVQLAADPDEGVIRSMWKRISQANSDLLRDRELAVQTTVSGGTTFYRLRVGPFGGVSEARAVCQALKARGQDCIVARNG